MKKKYDLNDIEPVKLKPLLGMKPGMWLSICYFICIVALVFAIGILPSIIKGYNRVTFTNNGANAAVYIDDVYYGGTPFSINVGSGVHNVKYEISGHIADEFEIKISHPVFFSWLFPTKLNVNRNAEIPKESYEDTTRSFFEELSAWSAVLSYDNRYSYPPIFTTYANNAKGYDKIEKVLSYAVQFITTNEMLSDAKKAYDLLGIGTDFSQIEKAVADKSFRTESRHIYGKILRRATLNTPFTNISGFNYGDFNLASLPVNETLYAYFTQEVPYWSLENKETLIEEGLVDEYYLDGVTLNTNTESYKPIRNISFYAAKAFCQWLSKKTTSNVFLPSEIQWTAAASSAKMAYTKTLSALQNQNYPSGMFGGVWEYTSTYYVPNSNIIDSDIQDFLESNNYVCEPIVKGGSYANNPEKISAYTVGLQSPYLCSEYYGFRIAWK